ncbi:MAG: Fe-S cluster assembly protein SufD [Candidatus Obscuribacterales bacterium]|nr:Fe-S cluster assembly protein SufD [Candidatus Obscuribacterales bacterium]
MAELETANTIAKQTVEELASRLAEPAWLVDNRLSAWETYYKTPMPTDRDEGWKRTDMSALDLSGLKTAVIPVANSCDNSKKSPAWLANALEQFGSHSGVLYQGAKEAGFFTLDPALAAKGVIFCDIGTAINKHEAKIKPYFSEAMSPDEDGKFGLLAKALFNCGLFLYVPRGVEIEAPFFYALDLSDCQSEAVLPRTLVIAEDLSQAKLAYIVSSGEEQGKPRNEANPNSLVSQYVEMHVKPSAKLTYLEVQLQASDVAVVNRSNCLVDRDGRYESLTLALGGCQTKSDMATILRAPGASSEILGVVLGGDEEKFSFNTIQDHAASDTKSEINFRVALKEKSSSVYQGIVRVAKVAQRTDAHQSNKNLLLDGTATADSIPKLEILADDVKCSHGATVGPVDREQIFYLMSRGVTRQVAEQLIVLGFFRQTLEMFPFNSGLKWLSEAVSRKMNRGQLDASASDFFSEKSES